MACAPTGISQPIIVVMQRNILYHIVLSWLLINKLKLEKQYFGIYHIFIMYYMYNGMEYKQWWTDNDITNKIWCIMTWKL